MFYTKVSIVFYTFYNGIYIFQNVKFFNPLLSPINYLKIL